LDTLKSVEVVTFLSSSTVDAFMESIEGDLEAVKDIKFASIGPVTSETMRKHGLSVDYEAKIYNVDGIIEAIK
ncbi:uroporphyrinogen-III synthase, partial [Fusobacterium sp. DD4]